MRKENGEEPQQQQLQEIWWNSLSHISTNKTPSSTLNSIICSFSLASFAYWLCQQHYEVSSCLYVLVSRLLSSNISSNLMPSYYQFTTSAVNDESFQYCFPSLPLIYCSVEHFGHHPYVYAFFFASSPPCFIVCFIFQKENYWLNLRLRDEIVKLQKRQVIYHYGEPEHKIFIGNPIWERLRLFFYRKIFTR